MARQGLKTKDKLFQLGVVVDDLCQLCGLQLETHHHLFFTCPFSRLCVEVIKSWIGLSLKPFAYRDFRKRHLSKIKQHLFTAIYACTINYIWKCRNKAVWYAFIRSPGHVLTIIKHEIRQRCYALNIMDAVVS